MRKAKLKKINFKMHIALLIVIAFVISTAGLLIISIVRNFYYEQMKMESHRLANSYVSNLEHAITATDIINTSLEEKILSTGYAVSYQSKFLNNALLAQIAKEMAVDGIYAYNTKGEVIYASDGNYIGWKAYEGHPVDNFMKSNLDSLVEDIRQDTITGIYWRYGYFKTSNGWFFQIGVLAEKIYTFLDYFEMQHLLDKITRNDYIIGACFIDNNLNIIAGSEYYTKDKNILTEDVKINLAENKTLIKSIEIDGNKVYQIMVPITVNDKRAGTLIIDYDLKNTEALINNVSSIGLTALIIICILIFAIILSSYNKNIRLTHYAYFDFLTDLPNKRYFEDTINNEINSIDEKKRAILLINLVNFRLLNITYGYQYGENLIKKLSKAFTPMCNDNCSLFHISADRFVFYIKSYRCKKELLDLGELILGVLRTILSTIPIVGNIGIVEIDKNTNNANSVLKHASIATENVNKDDSFGYCFFNNEMETKINREEMIEKEIRIALSDENQQKIYLVYQPKVELKTNNIVGFEALARMTSEHFGNVSPIEFIEIAERKMLIAPLSNLILKIACKFIKNLNNKGFEDMKVAVNISGLQLLQEEFIPTVLMITKEIGIKQSSLELEITESVHLDNYEIINQKLKELQNNNIKISLDDFGTGYSSLSRIRDLNIDFVKVDKSFIDKITGTDVKTLITKEIISMAHKLGYKVIAEGVEEEEQRKYLLENHCDIMQGYLFSRPLSEEDAVEILKREERC